MTQPTVSTKRAASPEWPVLGTSDPPLDLSREEAAFERERQRLVRDHPGKLVLIHDDDIVGVFDSVDEALHEGARRFGLVQMVIREITASDPPEFMPLVDINHPSFKPLL